MNTSTSHRILAMVLACLALATSFVITSAAFTADTADAAPTCVQRPFARPLCFQPVVPASNCLSPYVENGAQCVAYNPDNSVTSQLAWTCPEAPFNVTVSANLLTIGGYTYIYSCSYTPAANSYFSFVTTNSFAWQ